MSPGLTERPLGRFSVAPTTATILTGSPSRAIARDASITAAPPDMSNFISAIFAPGFSEIPPLSNVTALPTNPSSGPAARRPALVAQRDQRRLLLGALRDRRERAHRPRHDPVAALDLDATGPRSRSASSRRVLGQRGRRQIVGRAVLQVARRVHRLGDDRSRSLDRRRRRSPSPVRRSGAPACLGGAVASSASLARLVAVEAVVGEQRALDQRRRNGRRGRRCGRVPAQRTCAEAHWRDRARRAAATRARSGVNGSRLPEAHDQPALALARASGRATCGTARLAACE